MVGQRTKETLRQVCMADKSDQATHALTDNLSVLHIVKIGETPSLGSTSGVVEMNDVESARPQFEAFANLGA